ncbi:histamine H2 receptor-like [Anneissia japonica]|uniref:histamine H2 receptor-like n=1 Tax=Anneissia japonica TaxID=1529436 RepID=UPI0014259368|nr:histamine H2 receptor-like [Anneissia japonica]
MGNDTGVSEGSPHVLIIALRTLFLILCAFLTIGGNILSILVLNRLKSMSEVPKIFLLSLAFTDLCMGLLNDLFSIIPGITSSWPYGDAFCKVIGISGSIFCGVSLLSLMSVSVDRYIAISKPLHYIQLVTRPRALCVVTTIWISTCILVTLSSILKGDGSVIYNPRLCTCMVAWGDTEFKTFNLITLFAFIMVPAIGMLLLYIRLFFISRRHIRKITEVSTGNPPVISRHERKAIKTLFIVTGAFNVAWLPFLIAHSYLAISGKVIDDRLLFFVLWLAISNSWWNVLIYSVTNRAYRNTASAFLISLLPGSRNIVQRFNGDPEDTNTN